LLVLSLLDSLRGEKETAVSRAEQGIFLARELRTPFTEAVAWQRLGHALLVSGDYERSLQAYERGLELGEQLNVRRLQAEGLMGKGLLLGRNPGGNLVSARHALEEGLQVARWAGDEWIEGILQICLAAVLTEHAEYAEALGAAQTARAVLENCGDQFGLALAQLWTGLASSDHVELVKAIALCRRQNYGFLLEKPTIFGPKQGELFKRINEANRAELINGNRMGRVVPPLAQREHATALKITTLGIFSVLKPDGVELSPRDWQREKARQLFQLLLTHRDKPLSKDQIIEYLWPESDYVSAEARFKVALNALVKALEPERSSRSQSSYILRSGSGSNLSYALNTTPGVLWLDAIEFEKLAAAATHSELQERKANSTALELYTRALELYRGDFLPGCLYEDWAAAERERLLSLFLTTAERLTRLLAAQGEWERCQQICQLILARDNCWEEAYRLMILSQWKMGNRAAALRTYEKCVATLAEELGIEPMPQTTKLFNEILQD
jgi:DNA-binding SARP family transcriptional activator